MWREWQFAITRTRTAQRMSWVKGRPEMPPLVPASLLYEPCWAPCVLQQLSAAMLSELSVMLAV